MIKIENLNKYYNKGKGNEIHVINDVSLELPNTGLISFLGPSGSGKTTLLNVIGGLDKAKGNIQYDDLTMDKYSMHKIDKFRSKEIGYVFQNYNLLLEETVYSNLEIALEMIGIYDKEEQGKRIEYTLKAVGMYKYRKKRAYALSGGQQQRVSIAGRVEIAFEHLRRIFAPKVLSLPTAARFPFPCRSVLSISGLCNRRQRTPYTQDYQ